MLEEHFVYWGFGRWHFVIGFLSFGDSILLVPE